MDADIPKSLMLLHGQNPYSTQPWASPYPLLLLLVDSGIIRLTGFFSAQSSTDLISQNLRMAGLVANAIVASIVYLFIRRKTKNPLTPLISAGLFLTLPALSTSPLYFFHSDTFGYPILGLSLVALASHKYTIGVSLLATAAIFKIHPILALPLALVWIVRTRSIRTAILPILTATTILALGLLLPLALPGYAASILGFNLTNNGNGTALFNLLGVADSVLPPQLAVTPTALLADQVWMVGTFALFTILLGTVWTRARQLAAIDIVLLGLLAWLIPLKIEYTHYMAWAVIPVLMRGQIRQTIPVLGLLQLGDSLSYWSWWPATSLIPGIDTFYGLLAASIVYRAVGLAALGFVLYSLRKKKRVFALVDTRRSSEEPAETPQTDLATPVIR